MESFKKVEVTSGIFCKIVKDGLFKKILKILPPPPLLILLSRLNTSKIGFFLNVEKYFIQDKAFCTKVVSCIITLNVVLIMVPNTFLYKCKG